MLAAFITLTLAQNQASGTFKPATGDPIAWSVNEHHALIWDGQPYIPMGLHIDGSSQGVQTALNAGAKDVIVDLPANGSGWAEAIGALEEKGVNYMIDINSASTPAVGMLVQPETYRLGGITKEGDISFPVPGATSAYAILVTQRDGAIVTQKRYKPESGVIKVPADTQGQEHVLLVYPEATSMAQPDYWDEFDAHRDEILASLRAAKLGRHFRGIVDPIGQAVSLFGRPRSFVPTSNAFRLELKAHLVNRYRNLDTLEKAWSIGSNDFTTLDDVSRLVPLFTDTRGVQLYYDPTTERTYRCTTKTSTVWSDIDDVIQAAAMKRFDRLVTAIRGITDVPIVQEWNGWRGPYETAKPSFNGVGIVTSGNSPSQWLDSAAPAASSLFRWSNRGWLLATSISAPTLSDAAAELGSLGVRGFFARPSVDVLKEIKGLTGETTLAQWSPTPLFYPEAASNPAAPMRLPSGNYWLPAPIAGNRLEFGPMFLGYRYEQNGQTTTVLWSPGGRARVKLRVVDPKILEFHPIDGIDAQPKLLKNAVEVTIGEVPMLITGTTETPVPEPAYLQTIARFERLTKIGEPRQIDLMQQKYGFKDALAGFERNPGPSFAAMRRQYWAATSILAPYTWAEAELPRAHNFSEIVGIPGTNSGGVLRLVSMGPLDPRGNFAEYQVPLKTSEDQDIWISAMIRPEDRPYVKVRAGGEEFGIQGEPTQQYASGFAWYRFGTTKLPGATARIQIVVNNDGPVDMMFDSIYLAPPGMPPTGVLPPEIVEETGR